MTIETSKDLLYVVLAFCALWLTIFLSWLLYYVIALLRDTETVVKQIKGVVEKVDSLQHAVHDKFERSAASLTLIASTLKELIMWGIHERSKTRTATKVPVKKR